MAIVSTPLKPSANDVLLDAIRADSSPAYQSRIPQATKGSVQSTMQQLLTHRASYNEFLDQLVNRIGLVIARNSNWTNPFATFKRGMLEFGSTIEEIQVGLVEARNYEPDRDHLERDIFGTNRPEVQANFHTVNRQNYYPVTVNDTLLRRAFLEEQGLSTFVTKLMASATNSDQWDEFLLMCNLFPLYGSNGGYFKVNIPDLTVLTSSQAQAQSVLRQMRSIADNLTFLSTKFNAAHMPTYANRDELVIFCTPEFKAAVDVEALAGAFNIEYAQMYGRIFPVPQEQFGITGCQAIMTTTDFFVVADQVYDTTSQWNPVSRQTNYFLHHSQVISASRFAPAVMFWTGAGDTLTTLSTPVTALTTITANDENGNAVTSGSGSTLTVNTIRGGVYELIAQATTTPAGGFNTAVRWSITGNTDPRTFVTAEGVLHVGGQEGGTNIVVTATAVWIDPNNILNNGISETILVAVTGNAIPDWPINGSPFQAVTQILVDGIPVSPAFTVGNTNYTVAAPAAPTGTTIAAGTGGSLPATARFYKVSQLINGYESAASAELTVTPAANGTVVLTFSGAGISPFATQINIYESATTGTETFYKSITFAAGQAPATWTDTSAGTNGTKAAPTAGATLVPVTPSQVVVVGPNSGDVTVTVASDNKTVTIAAASAPGDPVYTVVAS